jgi:hypothetical protein
MYFQKYVSGFKRQRKCYWEWDCWFVLLKVHRTRKQSTFFPGSIEYQKYKSSKSTIKIPDKMDPKSHWCLSTRYCRIHILGVVECTLPGIHVRHDSQLMVILEYKLGALRNTLRKYWVNPLCAKVLHSVTTVSFAVDPKENVASTYKQCKEPSRGAWPDLPWDPYKMCQSQTIQVLRLKASTRYVCINSWYRTRVHCPGRSGQAPLLGINCM